MGKKRKQKASRSDKRMQKLYADAIKEVKNRNINIDDLPAANNETSTEDNSIKEELTQQKPRKNAKDVLDEIMKKREELRKPKVSLCVPVSRLVPFKPQERGLEFPRDFRRDSTSLSWVPRSEKPLCDEEYNGRRSPSSDFNDDIEEDVFCYKETLSENSVDEILQVFPLRIGEEDDTSLPETSARSQHFPPIYRQDFWRETMRRASEPSRSIPAKHDAWRIRDPASLMVGKQELYRREKCRSTVSLAERRFRLRAASTGAMLP